MEHILNDHLPIQKCISGRHVKELSDIELLAVILGTGLRDSSVIEIAARLYNDFRGLSGIYSAGIRELSSVSGIGTVKAIRILSSLEAGRRILASSDLEMQNCDSPLNVWKCLLPEIACLKQEEFRVIVLDNKNRIIRITRISIGTVSETIVHPREIFRDAVKESGVSIILAHNHPSGVLTPSREDIEVTRRIIDAGKIMGIHLLDHLIVSDRGYLSMKEEGYMH
jgi:DNA repair protein RadC